MDMVLDMDNNMDVVDSMINYSMDVVDMDNMLDMPYLLISVLVDCYLIYLMMIWNTNVFDDDNGLIFAILSVDIWPVQ